MIIEIANRFSVGPLLGFSMFNPDEKFDYYEVTIYLIFIQITFKWE